MAKKKGGKGGGSAAKASPREDEIVSPSGNSTAALPQDADASSQLPDAAAAAAAATPEGPITPAEPAPGSPVEAQPAAAPEASPSGGDQDDLRAQLAAAQAEIAQLKQQLATRDEEVTQLRKAAAVGVPSSAPAQDLSKDAGISEEFEQLQQRVATLRQEQVEAELKREAAWRQLRSVVDEITKLAAPDNLPKAGTPTATAPPNVFVA